MTNQELHLRAVTLAEEYLSTEGQLLLVLIEMRKRGKAATLSDTIAWMAEEVEKRYSPEKRAVRVSSRKTVKPVSPGRHPIPAPVRHAVIKRQGFRCAYKTNGTRCSQRRWLDFHHVTPVLRGGLNVATNLVLLCQAHHQGRHP